MRKEDIGLFGGFALLILVTIFWLNPIHKKNTEKLSKPKPVDRTKIVSTNVTGNVENGRPIYWKAE